MAFFRKTALATALAATALAGATPAMAQDRYGQRHHDNSAAVAIGAGVLGLAIGAIIASSNHHDRDDRRYYNGYVYSPGYAYSNGGWYDGYRYYNGWFYDRDGYRRYDRSDWDRMHQGRNYYGNQGYNYSQRYNDNRGYNYNRGYDRNRGYDNHRGYDHNRGYNGHGYDHDRDGH